MAKTGTGLGRTPLKVSRNCNNLLERIFRDKYKTLAIRIDGISIVLTMKVSLSFLSEGSLANFT
jgi:hypothetical protein